MTFQQMISIQANINFEIERILLLVFMYNIA